MKTLIALIFGTFLTTLCAYAAPQVVTVPTVQPTLNLAYANCWRGRWGRVHCNNYYRPYSRFNCHWSRYYQRRVCYRW